MLRVAAHRHTSARRLYRRAAFAWLCVEFCGILDAAHDRALEHDASRLHAARLTNLAVWAPEKLADEQRALSERAGLIERPAEAMATGLGMLARAAKAGALPAGWAPMASGLVVPTSGKGA